MPGGSTKGIEGMVMRKMEMELGGRLTTTSSMIYV
jgi:hypothetical protein